MTRQLTDEQRARLEPIANGTASNGRRTQSPDTDAVVIDAKGKLTLPPLPAHTDTVAQAAWLSVALNRDPQHPITGGRWHGHRGPDGHVELVRRGAPSINFEPASRINTPMRLIETLSWQRIRSDGPPRAYRGEHARDIAYVIGCLCDAGAALTEQDETASILDAFLQTAAAIEGCTTYGPSSARYEAATALQRDADEHTGRPIGPPRYLIDQDTGELVIRVSDLDESARHQLGSSLKRGWLAARLHAAGWTRIRLDGHAGPGRAGRHGPHARCTAYRGHLPPPLNPDEAVTT